MNILLCSTGINALGETFTLALFAQELKSAGHNCYFIAPKLGKNYLKTFGFLDDQILVLNHKIGEDQGNPISNKQHIQKFEEEISPSFILVADWHHYKEDGLSNNKTYSLSWFNIGTPMGTFDHVGFAPDGKVVNQGDISSAVTLQSNKSFQEKEFPPMQDRFSFIIRPCPHHNNITKRVNNTFYWGIYNKKITNNPEARNQILSQYKLSENTKIVFQPIGLWQERVIDKVFEEINVDYNYYKETLFPIIIHYLSNVDAEIVYIVVSGKVQEEVEYCYNNVRFIIKPPLKHNDFMNYLVASDLFLTDNLMSSNLGKAVFANVMSLVFKNTAYIDEKEEIESKFPISDFVREKIGTLTSNKLLFPYRSFPIGLCELEEMYKSNSFADCFVESELFEDSSNIKLFKRLLETKEIHKAIQEKQNTYIDNNKSLYSAEEILKLNHKLSS